MQSDKGTKRKDKNKGVAYLEGMIFGVPLDVNKARSSSANATSKTSFHPSSVNMDHDYDCTGLQTQLDGDDDLVPLPPSATDTPVKPREKKQKAEMSLADLQASILTAINVRADNLEGMITKNAEVQAASVKYEQQIADLQRKVNEAERYTRRWNLRLHGIPEDNPEDIKAKVINICFSMLPGSQQKITDNIDMTHRLGKYQSSQNQLRTTIIRFTNRSTRDLLWRVAKKSEYLKNHKLRFTEDLTAEDKAIRNKLWPMIEAARKNGKKAHFAGTRVIVDGKETCPDNSDALQANTPSSGGSTQLKGR
ncbi:uncharacterized protein si:ch211-196c10.15 [Syngnathoides biaculeatus]|uniref:uncharacterized protein si:ch211-196c10.15 n=1 Tax=Syngnathoides biaculeatus TaxID=300417 RepID=UPI002ADE05E9|nr:uncharacterized protein si:ch211-196c10.15 [Syngnathoides biaculeatus]